MTGYLSTTVEFFTEKQMETKIPVQTGKYRLFKKIFQLAFQLFCCLASWKKKISAIPSSKHFNSFDSYWILV